MSNPVIVGLGHYSRTGKDTLADMLCEHLLQINPKLRVAKIPFAWKLKEICHELYGWAGLKYPTFYDIPENAHLRDVVLPEIGKTPVEIWVAMGTPAVRENVYQGTWVDYVLRGRRDLDVIIIPDVRFMNEVEAIRERDGVLVKVTRPGVEPRKTVADQAIAGYCGWDLHVVNDGTLEDLREHARHVVGSLVARDISRAIKFQTA